MKRKYPVIDVAKTGQNIKNIMREKGFGVREIQEYLDLNTSQSIYHWFDGRNLPSIDNLYALSELFCVSVDSMLVGNRCEDTFGGYICNSLPQWVEIKPCIDRETRLALYWERLVLMAC